MANNVMDAFESSLQEIFNEFDTDNVGYLTLTQLEDCVESMGISDVQTFNLSKYTTNDPPTFALQHLRHIIQLPFIQQNGNDTTNDDIISVFNSIDVSKSGRISAADFENFLRANDVTVNSAVVREMINELTVTTASDRPSSREDRYLSRENFVAVMR